MYPFDKHRTDVSCANSHTNVALLSLDGSHAGCVSIMHLSFGLSSHLCVRIVSPHDGFLLQLSKSGALQLLCLPDSSLRSMLRRSLSMKPQQRPAVDELLFCLREAVLKTAIDDDRGRVFWQEKFGLMVRK